MKSCADDPICELFKPSLFMKLICIKRIVGALSLLVLVFSVSLLQAQTLSSQLDWGSSNMSRLIQTAQTEVISIVENISTYENVSLNTTRVNTLTIEKQATQESLLMLENYPHDRGLDISAYFSIIMVIILLSLSGLVLLLHKLRQKTGPADVEPETLEADLAENENHENEDKCSAMGTNPDEIDCRDKLKVESRQLHDHIVPKPFAWFLLLAIPIPSFFVFNNLGLDREVSIFLATNIMLLILWTFSLVADFIPALLGLLVIILFGLAPQEVAFSGFSSPGFILAFSIMGLGAVISASSLPRRTVLFLIRIFPEKTFYHQAAVFISSMLFKPFIPSTSDRAKMAADNIGDIVKNLDQSTRQQTSSGLYSTGVVSIHYLSPIFLTAAPANFLIFGLLPAQEQLAFEFVFWFYAALLTGFIMLLLYFVLSAMYFSAHDVDSQIQQRIVQERESLGSINYLEWLSIFGIIFLLLSAVSVDLHETSLPYITFAVLGVILLCGGLSRDDFIRRIDWSFLFLLGAVIGLYSSMRFLQIDQMLIGRMGWLGDFMHDQFPQFILVLTFSILLVRLFVPIKPTVILFAGLLLPIAYEAGVTPWVVGFIILMIAETAFLGYQSAYIVYFRELLGKHELAYEYRRVRTFHLLLFLVKLAAIYISIPFWQIIGVV